MNTPLSAAEAILAGFEAYRATFAEITRRAPDRFARRAWHDGLADAEARILLYREVMDPLLADVRARLGDGEAALAGWGAAREAYAQATEGRPDAELAETWFNSVTRRVLGTVGIEPRVEFLGGAQEDPAEAHLRAAGRPEMIAWRDPVLRTLAEHALGAPGWALAWEDRERDTVRLVQRLEAAAWRAWGSTRVDSLELHAAPFYRGKAAYLVGWAHGESGGSIPLVLALRQGDAGVYLDAVLTTSDEASVVFGFSWSYLHVDAPHPAPLVRLLRAMMPLKRLDELYTQLGFNKHGKTLLWRTIRRHAERGEARFEVAEGVEGLVMAVFTLPSLNVVFKIIKDTFGASKRATRREVMGKYHLVFTRDRVGRLADAQEFEQLELPLACFAPGLVEYLRGIAGNTVREVDGRVVIAHCYTERRVTPLDVHLRDADPHEAREAIEDYGGAIRDLAAAGIFPGDLLLKNFGVTRHGRVIFYDYDELTLLSECQFRHLPPLTEDEELGGEPSYYVGEHDVFPEEFIPFLVPAGPLRDAFLAMHAELLTPEWWEAMQQRAAAGEVPDSYPYRSYRRFPRPDDA